MSTLEKQIRDIEGRLEKTNVLLQKNAEETASIEQRAAKATKRIAELEVEKEEARFARQKALVLGEDPNAFGKRRSDIQEEKELREDEVAGLNARLSELKADKEVLLGQQCELQKEIPTAKIIAAARRYNELAQQLAQVVEEIWSLKLEMNDTTDGKVVASPGYWDGSLDRIPRLYIVAEEPVPGSDSLDRQRRGEFWDARRWRDNIHHEMAVDKDLRARGIRK